MAVARENLSIEKRFFYQKLLYAYAERCVLNFWKRSPWKGSPLKLKEDSVILPSVRMACYGDELSVKWGDFQLAI